MIRLSFYRFHGLIKYFIYFAVPCLNQEQFFLIKRKKKLIYEKPHV